MKNISQKSLGAEPRHGEIEMEMIVEQLFAVTKVYLTESRKLERRGDKDLLGWLGIHTKSLSDELSDELMARIERAPGAWESYKKRAPKRIRTALPGCFT